MTSLSTLFHSHLAASICDQLNIESLDSSIDSENSKEWLQSTAESVVRSTIMPTKTADPVYAFQHSLMRAFFLRGCKKCNQVRRWPTNSQTMETLAVVFSGHGQTKLYHRGSQRATQHRV